MALFRTSKPEPEPRRAPRSRAVTHPGVASKAGIAPAPIMSDMIAQMWENHFASGMREMMDWTLSDGYALILRYLYPELQTPIGAAAADLFCSMVADLPVELIHPDGRRKPVPIWFDKPQPNNPNFCARDMVLVVARQWHLTGNAYVLVERDPVGSVIGLRPLQSERVRPVGDFSNPKYELTRKWSFASHQDHKSWTNEVLEPTGTYDAQDILHLTRNPWAEEMRGVSQGMLASPVVDAAVHRQNHTTDFFREGAWKQTLITFKGQEGFIDQDDFKKTLQDLLRSVKARHRAIGVGYDLVPHTLGFSANDAQLVEATESARSDLAALGRTPPILVSDNQAGAVSYNSATTSVRIYASYVLEPFCRLLEDRFSRLLWGGWRFNWDVGSLIRGDVMTASQVDERLERMGVVSVNELREKWGYEPISGVPAADEPRVNRQYIPISKLDEMLEKEMEPPEPPPGFGEPNSGDKKGMEQDRGDTAEETERM